MNSIFRKDVSSESTSRPAPEDVVAIADHLVRLESLVDSFHELLGDLKVREVQLSSQFEKQLEWMQRLEQNHPPENREAGNPKGESGDEAGQEVDSDVKSWQQQRKTMLDQLSGQEEQEEQEASSTVVGVLPGKTNLWDQSPDLNGATPDDLNEIQLLKDQLKQAKREAEIELSMERARLSNEKLQVQKMQNDMEQREKELNRREATPVGTNTHSDKRVSRLKNFLTRRKGQ